MHDLAHPIDDAFFTIDDTSNISTDPHHLNAGLRNLTRHLPNPAIAPKRRNAPAPNVSINPSHISTQTKSRITAAFCPPHHPANDDRMIPLRNQAVATTSTDRAAFANRVPRSLRSPSNPWFFPATFSSA